MVKFHLFIGPSKLSPMKSPLSVHLSIRPLVSSTFYLGVVDLFSNYYLEVTLLYHLKTDRAYFS